MTESLGRRTMLTSEQENYISERLIEEVPAYIRGKLILNELKRGRILTKYERGVIVSSINFIIEECFERLPDLTLMPKCSKREIIRASIRGISHPIQYDTSNSI